MFSCEISKKSVSICAEPDGPVIFRYGRPGHLELQSSDLHYGLAGFGGGGEEQVIAAHGSSHYIVYVGMYRTNYGPSGRHDTQFQAGLLIQRAERIVSTQLCTDPDTTFQVRLKGLLPEVEPVSHAVQLKPVPPER